MPRRTRASPDHPDLSHVPTQDIIIELGRRCADIAIFVNSRYKFSGFYTHDRVKYMISSPPTHTNFLPAVHSIITTLITDSPNAPH